MDKPVIAVAQCDKCKKLFYPYGKEPMIMPAMTEETCPNCGYKGTIVWDLDIHKELARKRLGLDKPIEDKIKNLETEIQNLKDEFNTIKVLIQNLSMSKFEEKIDETLEKAKSELMSSIDAYFAKQKELPYRK